MMSSLIRRALGVLAFVLLLGLLLPALAVPGDDEKPLIHVGADLALVPPDTLWFTTFRVADLARHKDMKNLLSLLVWGDGEMKVRDIEKAFGLESDAVERVTIVYRRMDTAGWGSAPIWIVHTSKAYDKAAFLKRLGKADEVKLHGKTIVVSRPRFRFGPSSAVWMPDDKTIVQGPPEALVPYLAALMRPGKTHPFADELKVASGKHAVVVAMRPSMMLRSSDAEEPNRGEVRSSSSPPESIPKKDVAPKDRPEKEEPPFDLNRIKEKPLKLRQVEAIFDDSTFIPLWDIKVLMPEFRRRPFLTIDLGTMPVFRARRALLTIDLGMGNAIGVKARAEFDNEDEVKDAEVVSRMGVYLLRESFSRILQSEMGEDVRAKGFATTVKQFKDAARAIEVKRDGKILEVTGKAKIDLSPVARQIAEVPILADENNLKQIGTAFHNYHENMGGLPPAALCDKGGKPLLSWRVAILPYIEQDALYRQFKLDEAWDSPHNKKLLAKMPKIYAPARRKADEANLTSYQVLTGPNTLYPRPDAKVKIRDITDGTHYTLLVVEASKAVPWTKPEDIVVPAKGDLPKLGGQFGKFFNALLCDGTVLRIRRDFDHDVLRAAITPAGGEVLDLGKLKP